MVINSREWSLEYTKRAKVEGIELEYEVFGSGEPVLLIHGALLGDSAIAPFMLYPPFMEKYQAIGFHRAGYGKSTFPNSPVTIEQSAAHCRSLIKHIGFEKVHVVAHSYAGLIALQLAISFPEVVHSLTLLEAFLPRTGQVALDYLGKALEQVTQLYESGDKAGARNSFLLAMAGSDILSGCQMHLPPGNMENTLLPDVDGFFTADLPAFEMWDFTTTNADQYNKPTMPVLTVLGLHSEAICPGFLEGQQFLESWLPQAERLPIPGVTHGLQIINPRAIGEGVVSFLERHPM